MSERYIQYVGQHDVAKVEEHPFEDGSVTCMVLTQGHLKGRNMTPKNARELGEALIECAEKVDE